MNHNSFSGDVSLDTGSRGLGNEGGNEAFNLGVGELVSDLLSAGRHMDDCVHGTCVLSSEDAAK